MLPATCQAHDLWQRAQLRRDGLGLRLGDVDAEAILVLLQELDALEDVLLRLRAKAADRGDLALLRRLLQFLQCADAQFAVELADALGSEARNARHLAQADGNLLGKLVVEADMSGR